MALCARVIGPTPQTSRAGLALTGVGRGRGRLPEPQKSLEVISWVVGKPPSVSVSSECPLAAPLQKFCWCEEGTLRLRRYEGRGRGRAAAHSRLPARPGSGRPVSPRSPAGPGRSSEIARIRTVRTSRCLRLWGWAQTWPSAACGPGVPGPSDVRPDHFPQPAAGLCRLVYQGLRSARGASSLQMQTSGGRFCQEPVEGPHGVKLAQWRGHP